MKSKKKILIIILAILLLATIITIVSVKVFSKKDTTIANSEFVIKDTLKDGNGKKVKVFLLAGQSNASGVSSSEYLKNNIVEEEFLEYQNGYDNIYINYYNDNGNNASLGFVNVKLNQGCQNGYFGPELGMGEKLSELYPGEIIFIIKYAWGGTNLHTQWNHRYGKLYDAFIKFSRESIKYLKNKNYRPEIVSMMWMQGEADAFGSYALDYETNLLKMINSIRKDLKDYIQKDGMYFIDAYISSAWDRYLIINNAKQSVCDSSSLNFCIDTISEGLTFNKEPFNNPDLAHYDSLSEIKLGHLFIEKFKETLA